MEVYELLTQKRGAKEGEAVVKFKLLFAQEHKKQSVCVSSTDERRGLDRGKPSSWNRGINSRKALR